MSVVGRPGVRRNRTLRRDITWALVLKFAALTLLWLAFFSPSHRLPVDGRAVGERLAASPPASARAAATHPQGDER